VGARQHGDAVVVTAEAEVVEGAGALVVGGLQGRDGEAEGGCEVLSVLGNVVEEGRSLGLPTERLTTDSTKATSTPERPDLARISLMPPAAATASS